ncbi:hypothetical protein [Hyphomonas sp.]|uniref:hypothetical protein n=1 Tax=Hyphomonas sp. TaxID=87 RepID=UPI003D2A2C62
MSSLRGLFVVFSVCAFADSAYAAPACQSDWMFTATPIEGVVFGTNLFRAELAEGLSFTLQPDESGWHVEMRGQGGEVIPSRPVARGIPPVRGENNPTESFIFGPDVFEPAHNRELTVPGNPHNAATVEPSPGKQGQGWLAVTDQAFAEGEASRKVYMAFEGCVAWNDGPREPVTSHYPTPEDLANFPDWVVTAFEDCGLPETMLLSGRMPRPGSRQRAWLEPDLDGDGRHDLVALVDRPEGNQSGLVVCQQAQKTLTLVGFTSGTDSAPLSSDFLAEVDWWLIDGRTVVIGIEGAASQIVYLDQAGTLMSRWAVD